MIQLHKTLALLLLFGGVCAAQAPATGTEVLVFGDVGKPGLYVAPQAITVSGVIEKANGLSCKSANARIVRVGANGAQVAWAAHLAPGQPSTEPLRTGDILVIHSLDRMAGQKQPPLNVAIINSQYLPMFVDLEPNGGVKASDVMGDKDINLAGRNFEIIRTNPRAVPVQPNVDAVLMHGDLLMVGEKTSVQTPQLRTVQSQVRTVSQEFQSAPTLPAPGTLLVPISQESSQQIDDTEPVAVPANYGSLPPTPQANMGNPLGGQMGNQFAPGMSQPMTPHGVTQPPMPAAMNDVTDPLSIDPFGSNPRMDPGAGMTPPAGMPGTMQNVPGSMQPPTQPNLTMPGYNNISPEASGMNAYGVPMPNGSETKAGYPQTADASDSSEQAAALPLPSELDSASVIDDDSNATMWYVAGLGGALLLVLGAWVYGSKAVAESPQINEARYKRPVSARHSEKVKHPPVSASMPNLPTAVQQPVVPKPEKPTIKSIEPAATAPVAPAPVQQPVATPAPPAPQPEMPVPPAVTKQAPLRQPIAVAQQAGNSFNSISLPVGQPTVSAPVQQPVVQQPAVQPAPSEPIPVPDTSTTRVLDALINNSIPITEQPVQLPVHLEFYGDSSGPKNLRFDPPQTGLRGHHLNARTGSGQQQTTSSDASKYQ
jgi:hypothetical protein